MLTIMIPWKVGSVIRRMGTKEYAVVASYVLSAEEMHAELILGYGTKNNTLAEININEFNKLYGIGDQEQIILPYKVGTIMKKQQTESNDLQLAVIAQYTIRPDTVTATLILDYDSKKRRLSNPMKCEEIEKTFMKL